MESEPTPRVFKFRDLFPNLAPEKIEVISQPSNLIYFDSDKGISKLFKYESLHHSPYISRVAEVQDTTIVVAIDRARKDNDANSVVSFGVWFGCESVYNANGLLPADLPQTIQAAELHAVKQALQIIRDKTFPSPSHKGVEHIFILTESTYITESLSKDIWKWEAKKFRTSRNTKVANTEALKEVHQLIKSFEDDVITVQLWLVEKKHNKAAGLALEALAASMGQRRDDDQTKMAAKKIEKFVEKAGNDENEGVGVDSNGPDISTRRPDTQSYSDDRGTFVAIAHGISLTPGYKFPRGRAGRKGHVSDYDFPVPDPREDASAREVSTNGSSNGALANGACATEYPPTGDSTKENSPNGDSSRFTSSKGASSQRASSDKGASADFPSFRAAAMRAAFESMGDTDDVANGRRTNCCKDCGRDLF
jgi:ribonuclease HI